MFIVCNHISEYIKKHENFKCFLSRVAKGSLHCSDCKTFFYRTKKYTTYYHIFFLLNVFIIIHIKYVIVKENLITGFQYFCFYCLKEVKRANRSNLSFDLFKNSTVFNIMKKRKDFISSMTFASIAKEGKSFSANLRS